MDRRRRSRSRERRRRSRSRSWGRRERRERRERSYSRERYHERRGDRDAEVSRSRHRHRPRSFSRESGRDGLRVNSRQMNPRAIESRPRGPDQLNTLVSFPAWARFQDERNRPITGDGYDAYVSDWRRQQEDSFLNDHSSEDWFVNRFDVEREKGAFDSVNERASRLAREIHEACQAVRSDQEWETSKAGEFFFELDEPGEPGDESSQSRGKQRAGVGVGKLLMDCEHVVFMPRIPTSVLESSLEEAIVARIGGKESEGSKSFTLILSDPSSTLGHVEFKSRQKFDRDGWIECSSSEQMNLLINLKFISVPTVSGGHVRVSLVDVRKRENRIAFREVSNPLRIKYDTVRAYELAVAMDSFRGVEKGIESILNCDSVQVRINKGPKSISTDILSGSDDSDVKKFLEGLFRDKRKLDIVLNYLRYVHLICYYGHMAYPNVGSMAQGSSLPYLRPPMASGYARTGSLAFDKVRAEVEKNNSDGQSLSETTIVLQWYSVDTESKTKYTQILDEAIEAMLTKFSAEEKKKYVGKLERDLQRLHSAKMKALEDYCESQTKREAPERFRCLLPPYKLFSSPQFVHNHIRKKHPENCLKAEKDAAQSFMLERFREDPNKPLPPLPSFAMSKPRDTDIQQYLATKSGVNEKHSKASSSKFAYLPLRTVIDFSSL